MSRDLQVQVLLPAPKQQKSDSFGFLLFLCMEKKGLEPALAEGEHNREFARHLRMMGRAHQVLLPAPSLKALCIKALGIFIGKGKTITTKKQVHNIKLCTCHFYFTWILSQYRNDNKHHSIYPLRALS